MSATMPPGLSVGKTPSFRCDTEDAAMVNAVVAARLGDDIAARFGPRDEMPATVRACDEHGALIGGLAGGSHWRWLYIRQLWVDDAWRGRGVGRALLAQAEALAVARVCVGLYLDTFDPQAVRFYERCGFVVAGRIEGFPPGHVRTWLSRPLGSDQAKSGRTGQAAPAFL